jgi:stress-induced morphogen
MPMSAEEITRRIKALLPDAEVEMKDLAGDGDHWQATVTSASFVDKTRVQQHKLVYQAIGEDMGGVLHALAVITKVPA